MEHSESKTYFAPPVRFEGEELTAEIQTVNTSPVVEALLQSIHGLMAILDEHRQILAVNEAYLRQLGINNPEAVLGLRPGESIRCVHAHDMPAGCGTGPYCSTCGAAIAIVACQTEGQPNDQKCVLSVNENGRTKDLCFTVKASPLRIADQSFTLLFLQDITQQERRVAMERIFFHDVSNLIMGMMGTCHLMANEAPAETAPLVRKMQQNTYRLASEMTIQRILLGKDSAEYKPVLENTSLSILLDDVRKVVSDHPAAKKKEWREIVPDEEIVLATDRSLFCRVVCNLLINAFEATQPGGEVVLTVECREPEIVLTVWNAKCIPPDIARRIFQCHFSTKSQSGRGFGTYAVKLFGEEYLGGRVSFTSTPEEGTRFRFALPRRTTDSGDE